MTFAGYVTTNYDPGLLEARAEFRPEVRATSYALWTDNDPVGRWHTGAIFREEECPILYAHGIYQRSDTIVLDKEGFERAYARGAYRRLFEKLWGEHQLVFVGFGFSDPWVNYILREGIAQVAARATGEPRHVAILGLPEDRDYTPQMRHMFVDRFDAEPLFYPVRKLESGDQDHSALLTVLESLATRPAPVLPPIEPVREVSQTDEVFPEHWEHERTDDEYYVERKDAMMRLDRWTDDENVRAIGVTGMGGLGKTSLIGHWLKKRGGARRRPVKGLFYWSFYRDRDVSDFLEALISFAEEELGHTRPPEAETLAEQAICHLREAPLLVVLDGVEVMQEGPTGETYGSLLEEDLRGFLDGTCRAEGGGLVILTSRFSFTDLTPFLGKSFRPLELDRLASDEGAEVLRRLGVGGTQSERRKVSRRLEGHPLALRVFAGALGTQLHADPTQLWQAVFDQTRLKETDPLERKLKHLLTFYEERMPEKRRVLLSIISLFRSPVPEATVLALARGLAPARAVFEATEDRALLRELKQLRDDKFLTVDQEQMEARREYFCHPVLRDHFRGVLLHQDRSVANNAAALLTKPPSSEKATSIRELEPVLTAIELLIGAGDLVLADQLYRSHLNNGHLFFTFPAPREGMSCALGFVSNAAQRERLEQQLSNRRLGFYLNEVALHAQNAGESPTARAFYQKAVSHARWTVDVINLPIYLHNVADMLTDLGCLFEAEEAAREGLELARKFGEERGIRNSLAYLGRVQTLSGWPGEAMASFEEANEIEQRIDPVRGVDLYSLRGIIWADLLVRLGRLTRGKELTEANLHVCWRKGWGDDVARCYQYLGRVDTMEGRESSAAVHLRQAEKIFRSGHMVRDLASLLLFQADLHRRCKDWKKALDCTEEALRLAMPRTLTLTHADALVLRGRIRLDRCNATRDTDPEQAEAAVDDAGDGLILAKQSGYVWAERNAYTLLADAHDAVGRADESRRFRWEAELLTKALQL